jgi:transcriptional regulator with XRE-family HTH domain
MEGGATVSTSHPNPGTRLRSARTVRGLSVRRLASLSGCSASSISQIERGIVTPRVDTLVALTAAMRMTVAQLLSEEGEVHTPLRLAERMAIHNGPLRREYLLTRSDLSNIEIYQISIDPGGTSEDGLVVHGDSQEFCLVIRGDVVLELGDERHALTAGDCMEYRSSVPHGMANVAQTTAEILWVISPPDRGGDRRIVAPLSTTTQA